MPKRQYALFEKRGGKWIRISLLAYEKASAVKIFQNHLLAAALNGGPERRLRPVSS